MLLHNRCAAAIHAKHRHVQPARRIPAGDRERPRSQHRDRDPRDHLTKAPLRSPDACCRKGSTRSSAEPSRRTQVERPECPSHETTSNPRDRGEHREDHGPSCAGSPARTAPRGWLDALALGSDQVLAFVIVEGWPSMQPGRPPVMSWVFAVTRRVSPSAPAAAPGEREAYEPERDEDAARAGRCIPSDAATIFSSGRQAPAPRRGAVVVLYPVAAALARPSVDG